MQSTLTVHETDPHDIFVIEPDVVLAARPDASRPDAPRADAVRADAPRTDDASVDPVHEALSRLAHAHIRRHTQVALEEPLPAGPLEHRGDSSLQPLMTVADDQLHAGQATRYQLT